MRFARFALLFWLAGLFASPAYVLHVNTSGNARHWNLSSPDASISTNVVNRNTHAIRYFLASDGWSTTNTAAELDSVRAAFTQWQAIPGVSVKFEEAGLVNPPVDVNTSDNTNVVYWAKNSTLVNGGHDNISGASGVTLTRFTGDTGEILQGDIVFNGVEKQWITDFFSTNSIFGVTLVEGVALHEIGHFIGLAHSPVGGATMLSRGTPGVNAQSGLSSDDIAAARFLYPVIPTNYGSLAGTVTKGGNPVFGAALFVEDTAGNVLAGTVTLTNGTFEISSLPPGSYHARVAPLDPPVGTDWLCRGVDIDNSLNYANFNTVDTAFLTSTNVPVSVAANSTNILNLSVVGSAPAFRITDILIGLAYSSMPVSLRLGQGTNMIGVASINLPTSNATLTITGDGVTAGPANYLTSGPLNFVYCTLVVSSNATPGLRSFVVQQDTNVAYANGFLEIQPAIADYNFDGFDDAFQRTYFSPFTSANAGPAADPDGDGMNNYLEYLAGTNPTNAASLLKVLETTNAPGGVAVVWESVPGKRYQVISRTNALAGAWQSNGPAIAATNTVTQYLDTTPPPTKRYYRVQLLP